MRRNSFHSNFLEHNRARRSAAQKIPRCYLFLHATDFVPHIHVKRLHTYAGRGYLRDTIETFTWIFLYWYNEDDDADDDNEKLYSTFSKHERTSDGPVRQLFEFPL